MWCYSTRKYYVECYERMCSCMKTQGRRSWVGSLMVLLTKIGYLIFLYQNCKNTANKNRNMESEIKTLEVKILTSNFNVFWPQWHCKTQLRISNYYYGTIQFLIWAYLISIEPWLNHGLPKHQTSFSR